MSTSDVLLFAIVGCLLYVTFTRNNGSQFSGPARISNAEVWDIQRDAEGRLQNIVVHRDVKANA